jgi:hypothetical protein
VPPVVAAQRNLSAAGMKNKIRTLVADAGYSSTDKRHRQARPEAAHSSNQGNQARHLQKAWRRATGPLPGGARGTARRIANGRAVSCMRQHGYMRSGGVDRPGSSVGLPLVRAAIEVALLRVPTARRSSTRRRISTTAST